MAFTWSQSVDSISIINDEAMDEMHTKINTYESYNAIPAGSQGTLTAVDSGTKITTETLNEAKTAIDLAHTYRYSGTNPCQAYCSGVCSTYNSGNNSTDLGGDDVPVYVPDNITVNSYYTSD